MIDEDPEEHEAIALRALHRSFAGCRVLEIGCGDGRLTRRYADEAASVVATDPDADAIADLRRDLPAVDARPIGIEELVLPSRSMDVALFSWSL